MEAPLALWGIRDEKKKTSKINIGSVYFVDWFVKLVGENAVTWVHVHGSCSLLCTSAWLKAQCHKIYQTSNCAETSPNWVNREATGCSAKSPLRNKRRNSILMTCHLCTPRSGWSFWLVVPCRKYASTNQKHYKMDFQQPGSSDVISRGNQA